MIKILIFKILAMDPLKEHAYLCLAIAIEDRTFAAKDLVDMRLLDLWARHHSHQVIESAATDQRGQGDEDNKQQQAIFEKFQHDSDSDQGQPL